MKPVSEFDSRKWMNVGLFRIAEEMSIHFSREVKRGIDEGGGEDGGTDLAV